MANTTALNHRTLGELWNAYGVAYGNITQTSPVTPTNTKNSFLDFTIFKRNDAPIVNRIWGRRTNDNRWRILNDLKRLCLGDEVSSVSDGIRYSYKNTNKGIVILLDDVETLYIERRTEVMQERRELIRKVVTEKYKVMSLLLTDVVSTDTTRKLKRHFIRHLGINCLRGYKKDVITLSAQSTIDIPVEGHFEFKTPILFYKARVTLGEVITEERLDR
jgi:hypothetical protein